LEKGKHKDQWGPQPTAKLPLHSLALHEVAKALIDIVHGKTIAAILTIDRFHCHAVKDKSTTIH